MTISNEPNEHYSQCDATEICDDKICNKKSMFSNNTRRHTFQIKRKKILVDYKNKSFDDFRLLIVDTPQKLAYKESKILSAYFGLSSENISTEVISKMVLTRILKCWYEGNHQLHPSFISMTLSENISLKRYSIILK